MNKKNIWELYPITDDRRLEYMGEEAQDILSILLKNVQAGVGLFEFGSSIRALYLNDAYFECIGYTQESYGDRIDNILSTVVEEDSQGLWNCIMEHTPKHEEIRYTLQGYKEDGSRGYFEIVGTPLKHTINDNPVYLAVITNISDQLEQEQRIRELNKVNIDLLIQEERYKILEATTQALLFEYCPDEDLMIFSYNFTNNKKRKMIPNYNEHQKKYPLVHSSHLEKFQKTLYQASREEKEGTLEYLSSVLGGGYRWVRTYYKSVPGPDGKIASVLGRIVDIHDIKMQQEMLSQKADTDGLTGLYRKEAAVEKMREYIKESPDSEYYFTIFDLDGFKQINDEYGHQYGDRILRETAEALLGSFDENSIVGRFGGDEFIILTKNIKREEVTESLKKIREKIKFCAGTVPWHIGSEFQEVFEEADQKMYQMKKMRGH